MGAIALGALAAPATRGRAVAPPPPADRAAEGSLRRASFAGPIEAAAARVVDGDTFEARLRVWFGQEVTALVRLRGVDAPEIRGRCPGETASAQAARAALADLLAGGRVELRNVAVDKYFGRVVADVLVESAETPPAFPAVDVAATLLAGGEARPYAGRARGGWCG